MLYSIPICLLLVIHLEACTLFLYSTVSLTLSPIRTLVFHVPTFLSCTFLFFSLSSFHLICCPFSDLLLTHYYPFLCSLLCLSAFFSSLFYYFFFFLLFSCFPLFSSHLHRFIFSIFLFFLSLAPSFCSVAVLSLFAFSSFFFSISVALFSFFRSLSLLFPYLILFVILPLLLYLPFVVSSFLPQFFVFAL